MTPERLAIIVLLWAAVIFVIAIMAATLRIAIQIGKAAKALRQREAENHEAYKKLCKPGIYACSACGGFTHADRACKGEGRV